MTHRINDTSPADVEHDTSGERRSDPSVRTIAVTSGKGGVGKTSVAVNLAVTLAQFGQRVVLVDGDYGLGNVDLLLGLEVEHSLERFLGGHGELDDLVVVGPAGVRVLPATTGVPALTCLSNEQELRLRDAIARLSADTDVLLVDTASGISDNVLSWLQSADEVLLVTTPDRSAWVDAYAVLKLADRLNRAKRVSLIVNQARDEAEAQEVYEHLARTAMDVLGVDLPLLGHIPQDPLLLEATRCAKPLVNLVPSSPASRCFRRLARRLLAAGPTPARRTEATVSPVLEPVG